MRNILFKSFALGLLLTASTQAATNIINFNTDPKLTGLYSVHGNVQDVNGSDGTWRPSGGASGALNDGYLGITDASQGSHSVLVFKDLEAGLVVKAFTFECDVRIGGGTGNGTSPADGFSINYVSADDPIVIASDNDQDPGGLFAGTVNEPAPSGLAEEGSQTGLAVGFDSWSSGPIITGALQDVIGLSIRVDGQVIAQLPTPLKPGNVYYPNMPLPGSQGTAYEYDAVNPLGNGSTAPTQNVATNDPLYLNSLQTGARNTTDDLNGDGVVDATDDPNTTQQPKYGDTLYDLWMKNLKWEKFKMELTEDAHVKISWKGVELTPPGGIATTFNPRPGRIVFGGRTGGAWQDEQVDNITLVTIPADTLVIANAVGNPLGFRIIVIDSGPAVSDTNTIVLKFNDVAVTPTSVTKGTNGQTTIQYQQSVNSPLPAGSTNKVSLSIKDTRGVPASADRFFVVPAYNIVPAAYAATGVDTTKPGFKVRPYQTAVQLEGAQPNNVWWTEEQLIGLRGTNTANLTQTVNGQPIDAKGFYTVTDVINWDEESLTTPATDGNFTVNNGYQDIEFPGMPPAAGPSGLATDYNSLSEEVLTFVYFPASGVYTMGVNSDDGFKVTTGRNPKDLFALTLGQYNGGRGASDTLFTFIVNQAGYYPFRLIWENGGGGANCEWFTVNPDGVTKTLINDTTSTNALLAYWSGPALPAYVSRVTPVPNATGVHPDAVVLAQLTDGGTQVASATLSFNGGAPVSGTKAGNVTTITIPLGALMPSGSSNGLTLVWSDTGSPALAPTNAWNFAVLTYSTTLPTDLVSAIGSGDATKPGFTVKANQVDNTSANTENNNESTEAQLAGLFGTNIATLSGTGWLSNDLFAVTTYINWDREANDGTAAPFGQGNFTEPIGYPEDPLPGITGGGGGALFESVAEGIETYVEFPTAGFYQMGVNSDDNFRLTLAEGPPPAVVAISGPTNTVVGYNSMGLLPGEGVGGRAVFGKPPPVPSITAPIVYMTPKGIDDPGPYPSVTGKIALLDRGGSNLGTTSTGGKCKAAQDAGAIAVLFTTPGSLGYAFYAGATRTDINVPCVHVPDLHGGALLKSYLTNGVSVTGTISGDPNFFVGGFNDGRGATDTLMNFLVAQAGVYPMRLIFHQGGGGGNCEWFSVKADGTKVLVGDTAKGGLKAYRARTFVARPKFNATTIAAGSVTISWTGTGTLQQATALTGQASDWSDVSPPPSGNSYSVTAGTSGNKFFRLKQ